MGASVTICWPGMSDEDAEAQGGFYGSCRPWAEWTIRRTGDPSIDAVLEKLGVEAVGTYTTDGLDDGEVRWVSPAALEAATTRIVAKGQSRTKSFLEAILRLAPVADALSQRR